VKRVSDLRCHGWHPRPSPAAKGRRDGPRDKGSATREKERGRRPRDARRRPPLEIHFDGVWRGCERLLLLRPPSLPPPPPPPRLFPSPLFENILKRQAKRRGRQEEEVVVGRKEETLVKYRLPCDVKHLAIVIGGSGLFLPIRRHVSPQRVRHHL